MFDKPKNSTDLKQLLKMLHFYIDKRYEGQINVTGRTGIVNLIQVCIDNGGTGSFKGSAWDTYRILFERFQDSSLPVRQRTSIYTHKQVEQVFRKAYGTLFSDKDIIQFYMTVGGEDAKAVMTKYKGASVPGGELT